MRTLFTLTAVCLLTQSAYADKKPPAPPAKPPVSTQMTPEHAARLDADFAKVQLLQEQLAPLQQDIAEIAQVYHLDARGPDGQPMFRYDMHSAIVGRDRVSFERGSYGAIVRGPVPPAPPVARVAPPKKEDATSAAGGTVVNTSAVNQTGGITAGVVTTGLPAAKPKAPPAP